MDPVAALVDGPRARGAFVLRSTVSPPWGIRVQDEAPLTVMAVVRGGAWVLPDGRPPIALEAGRVVVLRGPGHYSVTDDPATRPTVVIHPGQRCGALAGYGPPELVDLGLRTWGNDPDGDTELVTGTYQSPAAVSRRLLDDLPDVVVARPDETLRSLVAWVAGEVTRAEPGQDAVLDRLLDLVVVAALRGWLAEQGDRAPGWYRAHRDPVVGPTLRLLEDRPAEAWTVASLAAAVGVSRATLARRFTDLVGEPPMATLAARRLALAADLMADPRLTLATVARRVGYATPFSLSAAFTRATGLSPSEHRRRLRAAAAGPSAT
jgi:AraC-like DNA-binding protein